MNTIIDFLAALLIMFAIAFGVYGIISTLVKYEVEKEIEELMKKNRDFYDDDDYEDMY